MIQVSFHKARKWTMKRFKVRCTVYYLDGYVSILMSK